MPFADAITDLDGLRSHYREPHPLVLRKEIDHIDDAARSFIAASPFVVVASGGVRRSDASPRGGPPGFVRVLDEHRLAVGDLSGNNRLDSFRNLLAQPAVGLLFVVPGVGETLRVNGRVTLTTDPTVLDATTIDGRRPRLALGIDVDACYIHCAKAFRRAGLWDPTSWPAPEHRPDAAYILREHLALEASADAIRDDLEAGYRDTLWLTGGEPQPGEFVNER